MTKIESISSLYDALAKTQGVITKARTIRDDLDIPDAALNALIESSQSLKVGIALIENAINEQPNT
jgi:hypothetical protein